LSLITFQIVLLLLSPVYLLQGYYNPHIINVIDKLISGEDMLTRNELVSSISENFANAKVSNCGGINSNPLSPANSEKRLNTSGASPGMGESSLSEIQGSCLYQINLPAGMATQSYGTLFHRLAHKGIIPLGLLRGTGYTGGGGAGGGSGLGDSDGDTSDLSNVIPYVYTNPNYDTELSADDRVFILSTKPIEDGHDSMVCTVRAHHYS
jgi:hypothetical protein